MLHPLSFHQQKLKKNSFVSVFFKNIENILRFKDSNNLYVALKNKILSFALINQINSIKHESHFL